MNKGARQRYADDRHAKLLQRANGVGVEVLLHHAPAIADWSPWVVCEGCDMEEGYECERPEWPCSTYQLVGKHYGATFSGYRRDVTMDLPGEAA